MRTHRKRDAGFTLPELLVAIALFAIIAAAMTSLQTYMLNEQALTLTTSLAQESATLVGKALRDGTAPATYIQTPAAGDRTSSLVVWANTDPVTLNPLDSTMPVAWTDFCLDAQDRLLRYEGTGAMPAIDCGNTAGGVVVAGDPDRGLTVDLSLYRPEDDSNLLQLSYTVHLDARGKQPALDISRDSQVALPAARTPST
ncbi:MAG TPA: prepilin-type N-terminal cleavage/methylation domain-containing protein [Elusimicrobiota bacterium]|jgi:prepilin-type N-terminal cleavage/methylation domain-containing protein|nr:prepilin-type N-terminal cleavage/methylation domain-containing protein [Elusimicrobiota bacterium]